MAISKVKSASITTDAVGPTQLNEASNYDFTGTVTGAGEANRPYFCAKPTGSSQTISHNADTKLVFNTEVFDSAGAFDTSTYRFTPQTAGKYFVFLRISGVSTNNTDLYMEQSLRKNGTRFEQLVGVQEIATSGDFQFGSLTAMIDMNGSTDYLEAYAYFYNYGNSSSTDVYGGEKTKFGAYLVSTT
jgi:hypothetical protein